MEENKYYASGVEITLKEKKSIMAGKTDKCIRCPDDQPGICLVFIPDHFKAIDGRLDASDPLLIETLDFIELPLEKTFIVQGFKETFDPLEDAIKGAVYEYW